MFTGLLQYTETVLEKNSLYGILYQYAAGYWYNRCACCYMYHQYRTCIAEYYYRRLG